jgi:hypothetical protein
MLQAQQQNQAQTMMGGHAGAKRTTTGSRKQAQQAHQYVDVVVTVLPCCCVLSGLLYVSNLAPPAHACNTHAHAFTHLHPDYYLNLNLTPAIFRYQQHQMMMQQQAMQAQVMQQQRKQQRRRQGDIDGRGTSHISNTAERRFFDSVKDILTSSTRDGWSDFVKQLDLFSHDVISKKDFLMFAEDIFGVQASEQFSELKRLMNARTDYDGHSSDT